MTRTVALLALLPSVASTQPAASTRPTMAASTTVVATPAAPQTKLRVILSGRSGGVSGSSSTGDTILLLYEELASRGGAARITSANMTFHHRYDHLLANPSETQLEQGLALLHRSAPRRRRVIAEQIWALETDRALVIQYPPDPELDLLRLIEKRNATTYAAPRLRRVALRLVELEAGGRRVRLFERHTGQPALPADLWSWDTGWIVRGEGRLGARTARFAMLLKGYALGPQRVRLLKGLAAKDAASTLLLSGGNEMATRATATGERAKTRALDFVVLSKLGYRAYCPGYRELYFGLDELQANLRKYPLPLVATNLYFSGGKRKGSAVFERYRLFRIGPLRVAVLGLVDPKLAEKTASPTRLKGLAIRDPALEAARVLDELRSLPSGRPDLVIALSNLGAVDRERLSDISGIDLLLGNFRGAGRQGDDLVLDLSRRSTRMATSRGVAYVSELNYARVAELALSFSKAGPRWAPQQLTAKYHFIDHALPRDEALHRELMKRHWAAFRRHQDELMPAIEAVIGEDAKLLDRLHSDPEITEWLPKERTRGWQLWLTASLWATMTSNLVLGSAGAEVAVLPRQTRLNSTIPGPIRERYVREWLEKDEPLWVYQLPGKQLRLLHGVLARLDGKIAVSGFDASGERVRGRPISDKESYSLVCTASIAESPPIAAALKGADKSTRFRIADRGARLLPQSDGREVRLRELIVSRLKWLRKAHGATSATYRAHLRKALQSRGDELVPRWTLSTEDLSFSFSSYANHPSNAWTSNPGTRETRTVTPSNYALSLRGNLALTYDSASLAWETALRFKFSRAVIDLSLLPDQGEVVNEPQGQDDIVASTELRLKIIELAVDRQRHVRIIPYAVVAFDTEFTPTVDPITQATFPHQKQLRLGTGLVSYPGPILQEARIGGLFKNDFDRSEGQAEGGFTASLKLLFPLWRAQLSLTGTLSYYAPTSHDTVEDLGLIFEGLARLQVPITRSFSLSLFADLYLYEHKVSDVTDIFGNPQHRGTGLSLILGAGFSFDHIAKL